MSKKKHGKHHRKHRRNPTDGLASEAGKTLIGAAIGVAAVVGGAIAASHATTSKKKNAALLMGGGTALGIGLHIGNFAPRAGKAMIGGSLAVGGVQLAEEYGLEERLRSLGGSSCPEGQQPYMVQGAGQAAPTRQCLPACTSPAVRLRDGTCGTASEANPVAPAGAASFSQGYQPPRRVMGV